MRKNLTTSVLAAAAALAMTFGASAAEVTVDEILENYYAASKEVTEAGADITMAADLSLSMEGQEESLTAAGDADMSMLFSLDPLQYEIHGSMSGSAMGMGGSLDMTMYMLEEDGNVVTYTGINMGEEQQWIKQSLPMGETGDFADLMAKAKEIDLSDAPITWVLAEDVIDINGIECYELTADLTAEDLINLFSYSMEKVGDLLPQEAVSQIPSAEDLQSMASVITGLNLHFEMDLDTETCKPMRIYMDTEGTDWTMIEAIAASMLSAPGEDGSLPALDINVNSLYMEALYDYDAEVAITVPEDVKAAAQEVDMNELAADLGSLEEVAMGETEGF